MLISKTPLRVSFVGGGSDISDYYHEHGGCVISTSVDKYIYVTINKKFDQRIRVGYSQNEDVGSIQELQHPLVREAMELCELKAGIEITTVADIPSTGSGLGSSSSFTVGLCNALLSFQGKYASPAKLAQMACEIEIEKCKQPIGKQDQYAAAYGGFNKISFLPDESVHVESLSANQKTLKDFEQSLLFFYTGMTRSASRILQHQKGLVKNAEKQKVMGSLINLVPDFEKALTKKDSVFELGHILNEAWYLKRQLSSQISSGDIDGWYEKAINVGAYGGKLLGAGGGGFLMISADPSLHGKIKKSLSPLKAFEMNFTSSGSSVIFSDK
jgi:D-glycero-alpha-D-manno-heptose-7-phosphate kinase